jgi:tape measure domain-containing protein
VTDQNVDLRIRAIIEGKKDLAGVAKSIAEISDAIDKQSDAAKKGQRVNDQLLATQAALAVEADAVATALKQLNAFQAYNKKVDDAEKAVNRATTALTKYQSELSKQDALTDAQIAKRDKLTKAEDNATARLKARRSEQAALNDELSKAGLDAADYAASQAKLIELGLQESQTRAKLNKELKEYSANVSAGQAAERALAEERARLLTEHANRVSVINAQIAASNKAAAAQEAAAAAQAANARTQALTEYANRVSVINAQIAAANKAAAAREASAAAARKSGEAAEAQEYSNRISVLNAQIAAANKAAAQKAAAAADEAKASKNLEKLATDAEASARSFSTLATASNNLRPSVVSLRSAVDEILDPAKAMRTTLSGVEAELDQLATTIAATRGPIEGYRDTMQSLEATQKALARQSGLVDEFKRQGQAVKATRAEFVNANAEVLRYAAAVRQGGADSKAMIANLAQAQARQSAATKALQADLQARREAYGALQAAGLATENLAATQERLTNAARKSVGTVQALTLAVKDYGLAQEKASSPTKGSGFFDADGGRTTLSLMQRLRGEVLSLVAAYTGLYGVINTAKGALDAFSSREGAKNQLSISVGSDKAAIDAEYAYVKAQSDRIGLEFERTIKGYAKFSAAATLAGRGRQEVRAVFESFSEVSRVANLTADDLDGVFRALEQIYSKGTIQAEELRGQLGDRLFGAFEIAASALKDQFPDLEKAMKNGLITSDQLVLIAGKYRDIVSKELPAAQKSLAAEQMRVNNAVYDFQLAVADSGWVDAYKRALVVIVDFMKSAEGENAAKQFGNALVFMADGFTLVAKNLDIIIPLITTFVATLGINYLRGLVTSLGAAAIAFAAMPAAVAPATAAVGGFAGVVGVLTAAVNGLLLAVAAVFAAKQLSEWAYKEFQGFRDATIWFVTGLDELWVQVKYSYTAAFEALPMVIGNAFRFAIDKVANGVKAIIGWMAELASAVGMDNFAAELRNAAKTATVSYADVGKAVSAARAKAETELKRIRDIRADMLRDSAQAANGGVAAARATASATPTPGVTGNGKGKGKDSADKTAESAAKKLESLKGEIENALRAIDTKIDRSQTESLQSQIDAIDSQYEGLRQKIGKLGGATGVEYMRQLDAAISELKSNVTDKFYKGIRDDFDSLVAELGNVAAAAGRKETLDLDARQKAIENSYIGLYQKIAAMREKLESNGRSTAGADDAKVQLDEYIKQLQAMDRVKFAQEELARGEARITGLIKNRDTAIAAVNASKEAGNMTDVEAAAEINKINAASLPGINAAAEATRKWAEQNAAVFATPEDKAIFLAQLEAVRLKASQVKTEFTAIEAKLIQGVVKGVDVGLGSMVDSLQQVALGQMSVMDGFNNIAQAFGQFAAQFLREIAIMIIKQQIFNALKNSGNPVLAAVGVAGSATVQHTGGVVGSYSSGKRSRSVDTSWFANAPRYHTGGIPGLASNEYATILEKGEEVLTADSPRHILNGGAAPGGAGGASGEGMRVVLVDDRTKVAEAMASSEGDRVIVQSVRRNLPTIKQLLKS